jgi:hypothetical protein
MARGKFSMRINATFDFSAVAMIISMSGEKTRQA